MITANITNKDIHWFNIALKLSEISECKFKHGAIILLKGRPLAMGVNSLKTRNIQKFIKTTRGKKQEYSLEAELRRKRAATNHAEYCCMDKARKSCSLKGTGIISARIMKNGTPGNSFPCVSCLPLILMEQIKYVVYYENGNLRKLFLT